MSSKLRGVPVRTSEKASKLLASCLVAGSPAQGQHIPPGTLAKGHCALSSQHGGLPCRGTLAAFGGLPVTVPAKGVLKKAGVIKAIGYHPSLARKPCLKRSLASAIHACRGFLKAARKAGQALPHLL
eukprot:jgi/Tetstr1/456600/TSEL_043303.t1